MPMLAAIPAGVLAIGAISAAATVASAGIGIYGAVQQAQAQSKAANYAAQVAANNAQVESWNRQNQEQEFARQALIDSETGAVEAGRIERKNRALLASNINSVNSSGIQLGGSALDAVESSALSNEQDVLDSQYRTGLKVYENQVRAVGASYNSGTKTRNLRADSSLASDAASNAETTGFFNAAGKGLSGASSFAGSLYDNRDAF